jgi:hypothetical protein
MPRSIAELNAFRQSNDSPAETSSPEHPSSAGHGRHGFDPNQPRVPAGHSDGGQWTKAGAYGPASRSEVEVDETGEEAWESVTNAYRADGTLAEQGVINRDGSRIHSQFSLDPRMAGWDERHTVTLPDGQQVTFEQSGDVQRTYDADGRPIGTAVWTNEGPEALAQVQPAFLAAVPPAVATTVELALTLGAWLASRNAPDGTAIVSFPVTEYRPDADKKLEPVWVGRLTGPELKESCPQYETVQQETDTAAAAISRTDYPRASEYGTAVHWKLHDQINDLNNKDLHSEISYIKTLAETGEPPPDLKEIRYGQKGSIRVDVLENTDTGAVCVYDIKTGKGGLLPWRSLEIARAVYSHYPSAQRIILIEMRPGRK